MVAAAEEAAKGRLPAERAARVRLLDGLGVPPAAKPSNAERDKAQEKKDKSVSDGSSRQLRKKASEATDGCAPRVA